jgi:hypothetical protein
MAEEEDWLTMYFVYTSTVWKIRQNMISGFTVWDDLDLRAELACFLGNDGAEAVNRRLIV